MWINLQFFVHEHGFSYATGRILELLSYLSCTTAAIWYVDTYDYYEKPPERWIY
jgi:hypothetical protein